jgi:hypothetical protein
VSEFSVVFLGEGPVTSPMLSDYAPHFLSFSALEWRRGGGDGVFSFIQDGLSLAALVVLHDGGGGVSVRHDLARQRMAFYSVANADKMNEIVDVGDDQFAPLGSFVSPLSAWQAIEDFFQRPLEKSARLSWMDAQEIVWPE